MQTLFDINLFDKTLILPETINIFQTTILPISEKYIIKSEEFINNLLSDSKYLFLDLSNCSIREKLFNWKSMGTREIFIVGEDIQKQKLNLNNLQYEIESLY